MQLSKRTNKILVNIFNDNINKIQREKAAQKRILKLYPQTISSTLTMQHLKNLKNFLTTTTTTTTDTITNSPSPTPSSYSTLSSSSTRSELFDTNSPIITINTTPTTELKYVEDDSLAEVSLPPPPSSSSLTITPTSSMAVMRTNNKKQEQKPALFRVTLQESTKRLSNLLQATTNISIRSKHSQASSSSSSAAAAASGGASSTSPPEQKRSSKFIRSSSMNFLNNRENNNNNNNNMSNNNKTSPNEFSNNTNHNSSFKPSKKNLLHNDELNRSFINDWLNADLEELMHHFEAVVNEPQSNSSNQDQSAAVAALKFMETNEVTSMAYFQLASHAKELITKCEYLCEQLEANAHLYDFGENVKANGYRSIVNVYDSCCRHLLLLVSDLNEKKNTFFFQLKLISSKPLPKLNTNLKEFQAWVNVFKSFKISKFQNRNFKNFLAVLPYSLRTKSVHRRVHQSVHRVHFIKKHLL
jgi:hypothetical protein